MNKADREWLSRVADLGCIACRQMGIETPMVEIHHILDTGRRMGHKFTLPLCWAHHRAQLNNAAVVSRHPYKAEFERRYGTELTLLDIVNQELGYDTKNTED